MPFPINSIFSPILLDSVDKSISDGVLGRIYVIRYKISQDHLPKLGIELLSFAIAGAEYKIKHIDKRYKYKYRFECIVINEIFHK